MIASRKEILFKSLIILLIIGFQSSRLCLSAEIIFQNVPDAGIQPVLVKDHAGDIHLLYFKEQNEKDTRGYYYYRYLVQRDNHWSEAIQISTHPYYRPHLIARAAMAMDNNRQIHVTWHQDRPVDGFPTQNGSEYLPDILYTRSLKNGKGFEPERAIVRDFITDTETGAAIAAYGDTVSLVWHGSESGETAGIESERSVYQIVSRNNGLTFSKGELIGDKSLGACGCCGLSAAYDHQGNLQVVYRTAIANEGRHTQLLEIDAKATTKTTLILPWELNACPVSTNNLARDQDGNNHLVFETKALIYQADLGEDNLDARLVRSPSSKRQQKHPAIAINALGEKLIVWNEGPGINGGGHLQWQLFNPADEPVLWGEQDERKVAEHSAVAVTALRDESFLVLY